VPESSEHRQRLSLVGAVVVVAGLVIGAGIFKTPAMIAGLVAQGQIVWIWVSAAALSLIGALCYVELMSRFPSQRGEIGFLSNAFGPRMAFVYGWSKATVINPGAIAMLAFVLADYWTPILPALSTQGPVIAFLLVLALTLLNLRGLRSSTRFQFVLLTLEVALLVAVSLASFWFSADQPAQALATAQGPVNAGLGAIGLAMIFALLTFGGWNEAAYLVRDLREGSRQMLLVLVISLGLIAAVYLLVNLALVQLFGADQLSQKKAPIGDMAELVLGKWGIVLVLTVVTASILTSINATMVVGARATASVAVGWSRLNGLAGWRGEDLSYVPALIFQTAISLGLVLFASLSKEAFSALVEFTAPVYWGFLTLVGVSLLVLRRRHPNASGFRVPLGPLLPVTFVVCSAYLTFSSLRYADSQGQAWIALVVLAVGIVASRFVGHPKPDLPEA
jgi:amino acid transporter